MVLNANCGRIYIVVNRITAHVIEVKAILLIDLFFRTSAGIIFSILKELIKIITAKAKTKAGVALEALVRLGSLESPVALAYAA